MGFDDMFEDDRKHRHQNHERNGEHRNSYHEHDDYHQRSSSRPGNYDVKRELLTKFLYNPKLRMLAILVVVAILVIGVLAVILLFPLLMKLFDFITANGIQGVVDAIWKGNKS